MRFPTKWYQSLVHLNQVGGFEQNDVMSPWQVVLHIRCVPKCSEDKKKFGLRGGSLVLCSMGGLLGVLQKSHIG